MPGLSLETVYHGVEFFPLTWETAKAVYEDVKDEVEATPFRSPEGKKAWELLKNWVTNATSDNRTDPGAAMLSEFKDALKNTIRRILARRRGMTSTQDDVDPLVREEDVVQSTGFSNVPTINWDNSGTGQNVSFFGRLGGAKRKSQTAKFCRCIKEVRKTIRPRKGSTAEQAAIGVCVKSVLHSRGRTVKRFKCGKKSRLVTQKRK